MSAWSKLKSLLGDSGEVDPRIDPEQAVIQRAMGPTPTAQFQEDDRIQREGEAIVEKARKTQLADPTSRASKMAEAKTLIAKAQSRKNKPVSYPGLTEADINSVGETPPAPSDQGGPLPDYSGPAVATHLTSEPHPAPRQTMNDADPMVSDGSRLADAQAASRKAEREAQFSHGMGQAADIISGTRLNDHAGEDVRAAGRQGVQDVMDRGNLRRTEEDQGFQRAVEKRAAGADQRTQTTFDSAQEMDRPGTRKAKQWEVLARAKRPREAKGISPDQATGMSANDWKMFLDAKDDPLAKGPAGPKAMSAKEAAALSKLLPPETANVYAAGQRINQLVDKGGGWDKVGGVGLLGGKTPSWLPESLGGLNETASSLRSEIGNLAATHLQSKGGKAITDSEERIILGKIAANPGAATPQQLQQAMTIIERNTAGNARQSIAALPESQRDMILENSGVPKEWVYQPGGAPTRQSAGGGPDQSVRVGKSGKRFRKNAQGKWQEDR